MSLHSGQNPHQALPQGSPTLTNLAKNGILIALFLSFFSIGFFSLSYVPYIRVVILFYQFAMALLAFFLVKDVLVGGISLKSRYSKYAFGLLSIWAVLSVFSTYNAEYFYPALMRQIEVLTTLILAFLLSLVLLKNQISRSSITKTVLWAFVLIAIIELVRFKLQTDVRTNWSSVNSFKFYFSIRHFGHFSSVAVLLSLFFVASSKPRVQLLGGIALFIATLALFFCAGRAAIFSTLFIVAFILILSFRNWRFALRVIVIMSAGFLASFYFVAIGHHEGVARIVSETSQNAKSSLSNISNIEAYSSGRTYIWNAVLPETLEAPWFGKGPDFYIFIQPHLWGQTPHNFVLQFALAWGWPSAIILSLLLLIMSFNAIKYIVIHVKALDIRGYWYAAFLSFILNGLVSSTLYQPVNMLLFAIMLAICFGPSCFEILKNNHRKTALTTHIKIYGLLVSLLCFSLVNLIAFRSIYYQVEADSAPPPYSDKVQFIENYPFSLIGEHRNWLLEWQETHPDIAAEKAIWAAENGEYVAWEYYAIASASFKKQGQLIKAEKALQLARQKAGKQYITRQERIDEIIAEN